MALSMDGVKAFAGNAQAHRVGRSQVVENILHETDEEAKYGSILGPCWHVSKCYVVCVWRRQSYRFGASRAVHTPT